MTHESALYIVATPIGNLSDITQRALDVLRSVSLVAAEDTRHSARLFQQYSITTPLMPYHDHSGALQVERILNKINSGESVALISDAGTPLISDPGYRLVASARQQNIAVVPVPGACALITALSAAGIASDRFSFEGFPPAKKHGRVSLFSSLKDDERTLIFYESTHRIVDSLEDMAKSFGEERRCVVARELTKSFETFLSGSINQVLAQIMDDANQKKGEFVVLIEAQQKQEGQSEISKEGERVLAILLEELPVKQAAAMTAKITGDKKNKLYQFALSRENST